MLFDLAFQFLRQLNFIAKIDSFWNEGSPETLVINI